MREKSSECHTHADHVRAMTDMCSRDPPLLHSTLPKANGKNPSPQPTQRLNDHHHRLSTNNSEDEVLHNSGGRLKFFKDGKFILELSHRRDGERTTWFPVPKKTFWPPTSVIPNRQESSASLSVSDDNSSIQSSPWQRDHCWKQPSPRRNISTEFAFYYRRNPKIKLCVDPKLVARKRRQPFDTSSLYSPPRESSSSVPNNNHQSSGSSRKPASINPNKSLTSIVDKLARCLDPNVVSPRKRILRELEKVSLEDQASKRRATPQPTNSSSTTNDTPAPSPKHLSSYSITSILAEDTKPLVASSGHENEPGFLRNLLKPYDPRQNNYKYAPTVQPYPSPRSASRAEPPTSPPTSSSSSSSSSYATNPPHAPAPIYGLPYGVPPPYRTPPYACWMHYSPHHQAAAAAAMHYPTPPPLHHHSVYTSQPHQPHRPPTASPPAHVPYGGSERSTLSPPGGGTFMPIRRSNSHRSSPVHYVSRGSTRNQQESSPASDLYNELRDTLRVSDMPLNLSKHAG